MMTTRNIWFLVLWISFTLSEGTPTHFPIFNGNSRVQIDAEGYQNVVVAISDTVAENSALIEKIKDVFTEFSQFIHKATKFHVYFKEIRILVPESWSSISNAEQVTWETFEDSDVRIDLPPMADNVHPDLPYTNKPSHCGSPGLYIHLTPQYLLNDTVARVWGNRSQVLAHEWGHYRWGVFDENPLTEEANFYASVTGEVEATRCSLDIKGKLGLASNKKKKCAMGKDGFPERKCRFYDDVHDDDDDDDDGGGRNNLSLMYKQYLHQMDSFCDNHTHNYEAPNKQNILCGMKSVWEVLLGHEDFHDQMATRYIPPTFHIIQRIQGTVKSVVLVIDTSGSMKERLQVVRQASYNLIKNIIPNGAKLGIVSFSTSGHVLRTLTTISGSSRDDLISDLPDSTDGGTSIGAGVKTAVNLLNTSNVINGGILIVLTDGVETDPPLISEIFPLIEGLVTVHTVALGSGADAKFETLSARTGGRQFQHPDSSPALFNIFSELGISNNDYIEITNTAVTFDSSNKSTEYVVIDSTLEGQVLLFLIAHEDSRNVTFQVSDPSGLVISSTNSSYSVVSAFGLEEISTRGKTGTWTVTIINLDSSQCIVSLLVSATSHMNQRDDTISHISGKAWWALQSVNPPQVQTLLVSLGKGYTPVLDVRVTAIVIDSSGSREPVVLHDDGIGSDVHANDGIYTCYFTRFTKEGRYTAQVSAQGQATLDLLGRVGLSKATTNPDYLNVDLQSIEAYEPLGNISRVFDGGSFTCEGGSSCNFHDSDVYAPHRITDLRAKLDVFKAAVALTFTAPGDDLMDGQATAYEIRIHTNGLELHNNFSIGHLLKPFRDPPNDNSTLSESFQYDEDLAYLTRNDSLMPKHPRETETIEVKLPLTAGKFSYVFAVTTTDAKGNVSPVSNIASVSAKHINPDPPSNKVSDFPDPLSNKVSDFPEIVAAQTDTMNTIPYTVTAAVVVLMTLVIIVFLATRKNMPKENLISPNESFEAQKATEKMALGGQTVSNSTVSKGAPYFGSPPLPPMRQHCSEATDLGSALLQHLAIRGVDLGTARSNTAQDSTDAEADLYEVADVVFHRGGNTAKRYGVYAMDNTKDDGITTAYTMINPNISYSDDIKEGETIYQMVKHDAIYEANTKQAHKIYVDQISGQCNIRINNDKQNGDTVNMPDQETCSVGYSYKEEEDVYDNVDGEIYDNM